MTAAPPSSTYRIQVTAEFTLRDAAAAVAYLAELGVGAVYVSPLLRSAEGSQHGYDVVDHRMVDPSRGGPSGLGALASACGDAGLGLVVDIVPNHMGVAAPEQNPAWWDVLRLGRGSAYADWFDIDWASAGGLILLPVLADGAEVSRDVSIQDGELRYFEHRYPLAPGSEGGSPADVHARQHYRLVGFRRAETEQNYRRFFAVTDLAGLRVEDPAVFDATHAEILRWVRDHRLAGLRVDHPDGLADPGGYLGRLAAAAPGAWITVEKITEPGEVLPSSWPVAGMTGYDALREVNSLLVDPAAEAAMTALYVELSGDERDFEQHIADGKRMVAATIMRADVRRLARLAPALPDAEAALGELAAAFPVYRSYLPQGQEHLDTAFGRLAGRRPDLIPAAQALLPRLSDPRDELAVRFQQLTGAVMAKGVEDTAYYRYSRLIGLNEVGGYPGAFGSAVDAFHAAQARRAAAAPAGMTTLATHDTKRSEDVRARLAVLAEIPKLWGDAARRLMGLAPIPNRAFGYLLWQTAVALPGLGSARTAGPESRDLRERLHAYAEKAMREAADGTGWLDPAEQFEKAVHGAVDAAFDDPSARALVAAVAAVIEKPGWSNALSQKLIQLTMPGVPDVYQGSELWDDSLVDPDNRRAVDYRRRRRMLAELASAPAVEASGAAKLWAVSRALRARRDRAELFTGYLTLATTGSGAAHAVAFDRGGAITVATRLPLGLAASGWGDTSVAIPPGRFRDALTGREWDGGPQLAEDLLSELPGALLLRERS